MKTENYILTDSLLHKSSELASLQDMLAAYQQQLSLYQEYYNKLQQTFKAKNDRLREENNSVKTELSVLSKAFEQVFKITGADSVEQGLSLLSRVHGVCDKLRVAVRDAATCCTQLLLAQLKSYFPIADTRTLAEGIAPDVSDDKAHRLFVAMKEDVETVIEHVHLPGDTGE